MSDEQKRFVLSRDTGAYSQLNPVSAQEASSSDQVEVKELHSPKENATTVSKEQQPSAAASGYIGNYYLLDLENFADQNEKKEQQGEEPQAVVPRPHRPAYENVTHIRMAKTTKWLNAILHYMRKVKSSISIVYGPVF